MHALNYLKPVQSPRGDCTVRSLATNLTQTHPDALWSLVEGLKENYQEPASLAA